MYRIEISRATDYHWAPNIHQKLKLGYKLLQISDSEWGFSFQNKNLLLLGDGFVRIKTCSFYIYYIKTPIDLINRKTMMKQYHEKKNLDTSWYLLNLACFILIYFASFLLLTKSFCSMVLISSSRCAGRCFGHDFVLTIDFLLHTWKIYRDFYIYLLITLSVRTNIC